jgi:hypothetical protein
MSHNCPEESLTWADNSDESEPVLWCPCSLVSLMGVTGSGRTSGFAPVQPGHDGGPIAVPSLGDAPRRQLSAARASPSMHPPAGEAEPGCAPWCGRSVAAVPGCAPLVWSVSGGATGLHPLVWSVSGGGIGLHPLVWSVSGGGIGLRPLVWSVSGGAIGLRSLVEG